MKIVIITYLFFSITTTLYGQIDKCTVSGNLSDEKGRRLNGATLLLLRQKDSLKVSATESDEQGLFRFSSVPFDTFILKISHIGYKTLFYPFKIETNGTLNLPAITLSPDISMLSEVRVVSKKPLIEQAIDKTIINVDAMVGSSSSNTLEVLAKTPGVTVDEKGALNLNGRSNVLVLIDGRAQYMSPQDLSTYLKSLPGVLLDKIELIDNPSSKYDAEGSSVINIRLKKNRKESLSGTVNTTISKGRYWRNTDVLSFNYNRKKLNSFGSFAWNNGRGYANRENSRVLNGGSSIPYSDISFVNTSLQKSNGYSTRAGLDFLTSKNTTVGFQLIAQGTPRSEINDYIGTSSVPNQVDSISTGHSVSDGYAKNLALNANFLHKFNSAGNELSADLNYVTYSNRSNQPFANYTGTMPDQLQLVDAFLYRLNFKSRIYSFKTDYTRPIQQSFVLETGLKLSQVQNDNDFIQLNRINDQYRMDFQMSNHFLYEENINAAYANIKTSQGRFRWQVGLRMESTAIKGRQLGNDSIPGSLFKRSFTDIFPALFLWYKLDSSGHNVLQLNFSRKIARPNYNQYNPFLTYIDRYTFTSGNPELQSTYPLGVVLTFQHKQFLTIRVGYGKKNGLIAQSILVRDNIFYNRPENVGTEKMYFSTAGINYSLLPWWYINYNFQLRYFAYNGKVYEQPLQVNVTRVNASMLNQFTISKTISADLVFDFTGKDFDDQSYRLPRYSLSGSFQKKIFKGKGSFVFGFEDLFHSLKTRYVPVNTKDIVATQTFLYDSQRLRIGLTYNFGSESNRRKRQDKDNAVEEETQRMKMN